MSKKTIHAAIYAAAAFFSSVALAGNMTDYPKSVETGPGKTSEQVAQEMLEFRSHPVVGGWRQVDSEAGWIYVGTTGPGKSREEVRRELEAFQHDRAAQARFNELYAGS